jgi:DNA-directed RNA polymerase III subunit RPC5
VTKQAVSANFGLFVKTPNSTFLDSLHLTPVHSVVNLHPQLHHVDAATLSEQQTRAAAAIKDGGGPTAAAAAAAAANATSGGPSGSARAIHMTIKTAGSGGDDDTVATETMADRLRTVQKEPWRKFLICSEDSDEAWQAFQESLLLGGGTTQGGDVEGDEEAMDAEKRRDLMDQHPRLASTWEDQHLLETISGIKKGVVEVVNVEDNEVEATDTKAVSAKAPKGTAQAAASEAKKGRPRGKVAGPKKPTKGKAASTSKAGGSGVVDLTND